ncbi:MAG: recombinase RecA, partial [Fusobacteriaceae bacterium]
MAKVKSVEGKESTKETTEKNKSLELALKQIRKDFGEGSIMKLGENLNMKVEVIP